MRTLPWLGLKSFFALGEDGWDDEMNANILYLALFAQPRADSYSATLPGSPANGALVILDNTHGTYPNHVAYYENGAWGYIAPQIGWFFYIKNTDIIRRWDGSSWVDWRTATKLPTVKTVSTSNYDVLATDSDSYIRMTNASANTVTVRPDATEALPSNGQWHIRSVGAGGTTIVAGSGVTINAPEGGTLQLLPKQTVTLKRTGTNTFDLIGRTVPTGSIAQDLVVDNTSAETYTLVQADFRKHKRFTSNNPITLTIPPNAEVELPIGTRIRITQAGTGVITLTPGAGVSLFSRNNAYSSAGRYAVFEVEKVTTDGWDVIGDLV